MQFYKGMDVSMLKEMERRGISYSFKGRDMDLFSILKACGANLVRLRLWQDPYDEKGASYGGGMNDLETTIELAARAKEAGLDLLLDFHYSDFWSDPGKQTKPKSWESLTGDALKTAVYLHTVYALKTLKNRGLAPDLVQVGNEITNGLLWPDGHFDHTDVMAELLASGIRGVRDTCPDCRIVLHLDFGTDNAMYRKWFDAVECYSLDFDIIGMSYYPHYNGTMDLLAKNMNDVSERYGKDVLVAETSIGYTTDAFGCEGMVFTEKEEHATGYAATQEGQENFLRDLIQTVRNVQGHKGIGVCYWEPEWIAIPDCTWSKEEGCKYTQEQFKPANTNGNQALFDVDGNANAALQHLQTM